MNSVAHKYLYYTTYAKQGQFSSYDSSTVSVSEVPKIPSNNLAGDTTMSEMADCIIDILRYTSYKLGGDRANHLHH